MISEKAMQARVDKGVAWLDKYFGHRDMWAPKVNAEELNLINVRTCMLGQLFADVPLSSTEATRAYYLRQNMTGFLIAGLPDLQGFYKAMGKTGITEKEAEKLGFFIPSGDGYGLLTEIWRGKLKEFTAPSAVESPLRVTPSPIKLSPIQAEKVHAKRNGQAR